MIILLRNEGGYHSPENVAVEVLAPCIFDMIDGVRLLAQMLHVLLEISIKVLLGGQSEILGNITCIVVLLASG